MPGLVGILENPNEMKQRLRTIATFGKSPRGYILALLLMSTLALFALTDATGNQETASEILDPTAPVPRELVLDTLRQIQELPARDRIHWQEAIAADRIPENAGILLAFLNARIREVDLTRFVPPIVTLPDGREVRTMHVGLLGPNLGANITQEDLNALAPLMAEGHEQVLEYFAEAERRRHWIPLSLHADDFAIFLVSREDLTAPTRQAVVTGEALQRVQRILDDRENPVGLRLFLDQNGVSRLREATRDAAGSHLVLHGPEGLRLGSIQIGYGSISSVLDISLARELVEMVIDEWEERSDPRRHEMEKILHIAQASIIYAHDNEEQLPGEGGN